MNPRTIIFVVVALAIAGGTALMVQNYLQNQRSAIDAELARLKKPKPKNEILVAKTDLAAGTLIKKNQLQWHPWPEGKISTAKVYIQNGKGKKMKDFIGAVVRTGIVAGEPITLGRVVRKGDRGFLAATLSPGMRAMSVSINATSGTAGFVFPGDRVDIILSHRVSAGGKAKSRVSETILEDVRIIAVDQITGDKNNKAKLRKTATLELTPKQVEFLTVAKAMGKLSFSLRSLTKQEIADGWEPDKVDPDNPTPSHPGERGKTFTSETEVSRLFGGSPTDGGESTVITVIRGKKKQTTRLRSKQ